MREAQRKGYDENRRKFMEQLPEHIVVVSEFLSTKKPITVRCLRCGREHTYAEAKFATTRRCHGCYLLDMRNELISRTEKALNESGFDMISFSDDGETVESRCRTCGSAKTLKVKSITDHEKTVCSTCLHADVLKARQEQKEAHDAARMSAEKQKLYTLLEHYIPDYEVKSIAPDNRSVVLVHKKCGNEYRADMTKLARGYGCKACSRCGSSKGVQEIEDFLRKHRIEFEREKHFDGCRRKNPLPFDFYVPSRNLLIEFNGEQHYRATRYFGGMKKLKLYAERDRIKERFAKDNGFNFLVIRWYEDPIKKLKLAL